jgi:hypothetical protein
MINWTPRERYRSVAWSIAVSRAIETGDPALNFYNDLMKTFDSKQLPKTTVLDESNET